MRKNVERKRLSRQPFLTRLLKQQPGQFFVGTTKEPGTKEWSEQFFSRAELNGAVVDFIEQNRHQDIYFCPHGFNRRERKKERAVLPKLLWADLDAVDPNTCKLK